MLAPEQIQTGEHDSLLMPKLLHAGHSNLGFVKSLCAAGYAQGWRPVAMVYRYASASSLPSRQSMVTFRPHRLQHSMHVHPEWHHGKPCKLSWPQQHPCPASPLFHERAAQAVQADHMGFCLPCRGCGGLTLQSPKVYNLVETGDVRLVVAGLRGMYPDAPILLAGFSMGAMLATKFLAEDGSLASGVAPGICDKSSGALDNGPVLLAGTPPCWSSSLILRQLAALQVLGHLTQSSSGAQAAALLKIHRLFSSFSPGGCLCRHCGGCCSQQPL